ncbi:hypothetical protein ABER98_11495 [Domibacillus aminovorans]|uniref:hypothetical protein n=1 Tax=Domibacillus aminovorans TaxID=29332 RepID=UPI003D1A6FCA
MNEIKGYNDLTKAQHKWLWYVQRKHLSAISSKKREIRGTGSIQNVGWNAQDACIEVHFNRK